MTTIKDWLNIILPGFEVSEGAISALSEQCAKVYDLKAAVAAGYEETYMQALYVAAHQGIAIEGLSSIRDVASKKEGEVAVTYSKTGKSKSGWRGTQFGEEFLQIIRASRGGAVLLGSAS
ncbi:DUF4054 domain-containing protein [Serratia marcescens]|uniref:DUF4054 domain-containing protein n=1 Tax=Serratia marcescens TaxID=615 RepID=UPI000D9A5898|nr:DUF4054 domain-containing protein [Serratia marcescens]MDS0828881.1 DUF4054 domain-containing protein [Serratia marcescens]PYA06482.1 hypothetical protein DMW43_08855 [Serratia marcescens]PYA51162.1 hypothetical protein DMW45_03730 [Serratia marcescens]